MGILLFLNRVRDIIGAATRIVNYCPLIYGTTNTTVMERVQILHHFAAKICAGGTGMRDHATPFITLKIERRGVYDVVEAVY